MENLLKDRILNNKLLQARCTMLDSMLTTMRYSTRPIRSMKSQFRPVAFAAVVITFVFFISNSYGASGHMGLDTAGSITEVVSANYFIATKATAPSNITATSLNLYVISGATGTVRMGIYSDNGGSPGAKLAETAEVTLVNGWSTGIIPATVLTSGTQYWLVFVLSEKGSVLTGNAQPGGDKFTDYSYQALPAAAPGNMTLSGGVYAIYASDNNSYWASGHVGLDTAGSITEVVSANYFIATKAIVTSNITATSLNLYVISGATGTVRMGIYSDNGGSPGAKLAETAEVTLVNGWSTGIIPATVLTSGTQYWLVFVLSEKGSVLTGNAQPGGDKFTDYSYQALPAAAPGNMTLSGGVYAIYASDAGK